MANRLKKVLFDVVHSQGYTIIPNWRLEAYPQATFLRNLFVYLKIDCVLDVGANRGQYRDFLRRQVEYAGTIVSFEPIPEHCELLRDRAKDDGEWLIEGYALGSAESKTTTFNVMKSPTFSSFLRPDTSVTSRFADMNVIQREVGVEVRTLETVVPELEQRLGPRALYLKLDTQGFDLEIARGAGKEIRKFRGLQIEASVKSTYVGMPDYCSTIPALQGLGFELSGLFPNNPHHFPILYEFDAHLISRDWCSS
jgi:FkbM family methyltransferase